MNGTEQEMQIKCLRVSNGAMAAKELPTRLKVLAWGRNETTKGPTIVNETTVMVLPKRQDHEGFDRVALDFEHNTVPGSPEYERSQEPRPVAAYGVPEVVAGEGLFLTDLVWTDEGKKHAQHYHDLSAAVRENEANEVVFLHSSALVRQGSARDVSFYTVSLGNNQQKDETMEPNYQALKAQVDALSQMLDKLKEDLGKLMATEQTVATQGEAVTTLSARIDAMEKQALVDRATMQRKVIPLSDDEIKDTDIKTLSALVENIKPTIPLNRVTPEGGVEQPGDKDLKTLSVRAAKIDSRAQELMKSDPTKSLSQAYKMAEAELDQGAS